MATPEAIFSAMYDFAEARGNYSQSTLAIETGKILPADLPYVKATQERNRAKLLAAFSRVRELLGDDAPVIGLY